MLNSLMLRCVGLMVLVFAICCIIAAPVFSATYFVSSSAGNDALNGTTSSSPWKTLAKVNSKVFQPGDTVRFKRGDTWTKQRLNITSSGKAGQPITFGTYGSGNLPKFDGSYDFSAFNGVTINGRVWIVIDGLHLYRFTKGIWIDNGASNITIKNSRISHTGDECVGIKGNVNNVTIEVNVIHDCGQSRNGEGIYVGTDPSKAGGVLDRTKNIVIRNNQIYNTGNEAIELKAGTSDCIVQNNSIHDVNDFTRGAIHAGLWTNPLTIPNHWIDSNFIFNVKGIGIEIRSGNIQVTRNVVSNARLHAIRIADAEHTRLVAEIHNNTLYKNLGTMKIENTAIVDDKNNLSWGNGSGNTGFNPLFVNPSGADFRLCRGVGSPVTGCPGRSPAIDAGVNVGLPFSGAAPDLGAEESNMSVTSVPAAPSSLNVQLP
jgi:Right handed beta helix region